MLNEDHILEGRRQGLIVFFIGASCDSRYNYGHGGRDVRAEGLASSATDRGDPRGNSAAGLQEMPCSLARGSPAIRNWGGSDRPPRARLLRSVR